MMMSAQKQSLEGVIDIHVHCGPDSMPRTIDAADLARHAKARGMRGLVIKNHYEPTASLAYLVRKEVPGIEIFGGVTLNLSVGGINPAAVEHMAKVSGSYGRFVWVTSFDSEAQVRYSKQDRPFVQISRNGELVLEMKQVITLIARHNLVLATGHSTPEEGLMMITEARRQGVKHILATHAMIAPTHMSTEQMLEAAELGAYVEFIYNGLVGPYKEFEFADYAQAIRSVGVERCILSSDLGQPVNAPHPEGFAALLEGLKEQGFTQSELDCMSKTNPAAMLDLY
jgi:hypothetical protein